MRIIQQDFSNYNRENADNRWQRKEAGKIAKKTQRKEAGKIVKKTQRKEAGKVVAEDGGSGFRLEEDNEPYVFVR